MRAFSAAVWGGGDGTGGDVSTEGAAVAPVLRDVGVFVFFVVSGFLLGGSTLGSAVLGGSSGLWLKGYGIGSWSMSS